MSTTKVIVQNNPKKFKRSDKTKKGEVINDMYELIDRKMQKEPQAAIFAKEILELYINKTKPGFKIPKDEKLRKQWFKDHPKYADKYQRLQALRKRYAELKVKFENGEISEKPIWKEMFRKEFKDPNKPDKPKRPKRSRKSKEKEKDSTANEQGQEPDDSGVGA